MVIAPTWCRLTGEAPYFPFFDWIVFKVTEVQPLMGLTGVRQMAASSDPPPLSVWALLGFRV